MKIVWSPDVVLSTENSGVYFTSRETSKKPRIILDEANDIENKEKILMMYDPDAVKPFIHWITTLNGQDILPYYPPSPPKKTGLHRYMFCLISSPPPTNNRILNEKKYCSPIFYFLSKYFVGGTKKRIKIKNKNKTNKNK